MNKHNLISMMDEQERDELRQFAIFLLVAIFGLICLYGGLKIGLSEGRAEHTQPVADSQEQGLPAENRREVVSRWYQ